MPATMSSSAYVGPIIAVLLECFGVLANVCEKGSSIRPINRSLKCAYKEKSGARSAMRWVNPASSS